MKARFVSLVLALILLVSCTQRTMIDAMVSDQDRAFALKFVAEMRQGDDVSLEPLFDPSIWPQSVRQVQNVSAHYPRGAARTELVGYHVNHNLSENNRRTAQYVLMTEDGRRWTRTTIVTVSFGGQPQRVVGWNVIGTNSIPEDYRQFRAMESTLPWIQIGVLLAAFAIIGGALFWYFRRRSVRE